MRQLLLLAGAATLLTTAPALAKPGHGPSGGHAVGFGRPVTARSIGYLGCPTGLAGHNSSCLPPGQVNRLFLMGQRVPTGYRSVPFRRIPLGVRDQYGLLSGDRYIYRGGTLYVLDPRSRVVQRIIPTVVF